MRKVISLLLVMMLAVSTMVVMPAMAEGKTIITAIAGDPEQMDPSLNSYSRSSKVLQNLFKGLYKLDADGHTYVPAMAESVDISDDQLTYTFTIQNFGNEAVVATDDAVLTDTFDPILEDIAVTYNGEVWVEGVNYTYDESTGVFTTLPGQITVSAATFTQNEDGTWTVTPGAATLVVTGTI